MVKIPKNYVLLDPIDDREYLLAGDREIKMSKTVDGEEYSPGLYTIRRGYLTALPNKIDHSNIGTPYINNIRPNIGSIVYLDYLILKDADKYKGQFIVPYNSLILEVVKDGVKMLNGYMLSKKLSFEGTLEAKDYDDRYEILKAGERNLDYLDKSIDDESIVKGTKVLTRYSNYPVLEPERQLRLDGNAYYYFRRRDVLGVLS